MKVVAGLGNPGVEYDATRHNVGWWVVDRLAHDWGFGPFRKEGPALLASGQVAGEEVLLMKPMTFMNRSGAALRWMMGKQGLRPEQDLLVVVDDAALEVGRVRLRPAGSPGGHNGLRSVSEALGTQDFARLRIGVGVPPLGADMVAWVLSPMPPEDEDVVLGLLPDVSQGVGVWLAEGADPAMSALNR